MPEKSRENREMRMFPEDSVTRYKCPLCSYSVNAIKRSTVILNSKMFHSCFLNFFIWNYNVRR